MTDSLWTVTKLVAMSFEPQWMFRRRARRMLGSVVSDRINLHMGVNINVRDFFGKEVNNIKEWRRLVNAHRELIEAMACLAGDANEGCQQEAMGKWIADVVHIGNRAAGIMRMLYPDLKDAPWRKL